MAPRRSLLLSAVVVVLLVLAPAAIASPLTPKSAAGFRDSVGVNTHIVYFDTAYGDWSRIVAALDQIGIDHLRDGVYGNPAPSWHDWNERYYSAVELAVAHGKRFDFGMGNPGFQAGTIDQLASVVAGRLRPAAEALEAPNEFDLSGTPDWPTALRGYVQALHDRAKGDPALRDLPIIGPSFALGGSRQRMSSVANLVDVGNVHPYTGGLSPTPEHVADELSQSAFVTGAEPVWATEAGFHDAMNATTGQAPVPEDVAAVYTLRTLLEHYDDGIARTYLYELIDEKPDPAGTDPEQHFGLLRNDFTFKPAAVTLENLLNIVGRPGAAGPLLPVDVTIAGDTTGVRELLLQDGSGHYRLALWQTANLWDINRRVRLSVPVRPLDVTVPATTGSAVTAYDPVLSADGHALPVAGGHVHVNLGEGPVILDFGASPASIAPVTQQGGCPCAPVVVSGALPSRPGTLIAAAVAPRPSATSPRPRPRPRPSAVARRPLVARASRAGVGRRAHVAMRGCMLTQGRLSAELGVRRPNGRFHRLAGVRITHSGRCRVTLAVPPAVRTIAIRQRRKLVLRIAISTRARRRSALLRLPLRTPRVFRLTR